MYNTIGFVPLRAGSRGVPSKNLKNICGKPLCYWVLNSLNSCYIIDQVFVAVDSEPLYRTVSSFNLNKVYPYFRDPSTATDTATTESAILDFKFYCSKNNLYNINLDTTLVLAQATNPMLTCLDITKGLELYNYHGKNTPVISCIKVESLLWENLDFKPPYIVVPKNYDPSSRKRRQDFDSSLYQENGAFYINNFNYVTRNVCRISKKCMPYIMPWFTGIEIDTLEQFKVVEFIMQQFTLPVMDTLSVDKISKVKLFVTDVDGVMTDAGLYYSPYIDNNFESIKKFNTRDGLGIKIIKDLGIKVAICTGDNSKAAQARAAKLGVDFFINNCQDKLKAISLICKELNITLEEVAFIGDDVNDLELIKRVGVAACPADSQPEIKSVPFIRVLNTKGGEGVVREFTRVFYEAAIS